MKKEDSETFVIGKDKDPLKMDLSEIVLELEVKIKELLEENVRLKERIKELESQLNKDSHNSSKPPSTDGFKKKNRSLRKSVGRKTGGQKGHSGSSLKMVEKPDSISIHSVKRCKNCEISLENVEVADYEKRQVFDIPPIKIDVTEHRAEIKICPCCGLKNRAEFPPHIDSGSQYGDRLKSLVVYLMEYQYLPYERTCEFFSDVFGHILSEGTLYNISRTCYESLEEFETKVKQEIIESPVVNFDETGLYSEGKRKWLHSSSTPLLTYYFVHNRRGKEAMDAAGILPQFLGTAEHDFWTPYSNYPCKHAFCNAHNLRDLTFVWEEDKAEWASKMNELLLEMKETVEKEKEQKKTCLDLETIGKLKDKYKTIIREGLQLYPPSVADSQPKKRGRKKQCKAKNLLDRLNDRWKEILAFLYDFQIPFDNNLAERDIRMVKVKQKISGTFRGKEGANYFCRIRGYISTIRKHGLKVLESIQNVFNGKPFLPICEGG